MAKPKFKVGDRVSVQATVLEATRRLYGQSGMERWLYKTTVGDAWEHCITKIAKNKQKGAQRP